MGNQSSAKKEITEQPSKEYSPSNNGRTQTAPGRTQTAPGKTAMKTAEIDIDERKMKLRELNEEKAALLREIEGYGRRLAQWQSEIEDPSTSAFKKNHLEGAVRMHEGWTASRKLRIKEIEEELWSIAAAVERMVKTPLSVEKEKRLEQEVQELKLERAGQQEEIQSLTRGLTSQQSEMKAQYLQQRERFEEIIKHLNEEKAKEKEKVEVYEKCLEDYQKEMKDPTTTERRREELESEVQEQKMEMRDNKRVIANIEAELQGINLETEDNSKLSIVTLHLIKWKDGRGRSHTFRLVDRVSASWRNFGAILGLGTNQLDRWEDQYRGDSNMCWARVMEEWLNGNSEGDYPVTWEGMYSLLDDAEFSVVTEELRKAVDRVSGSCSTDEEDVDTSDEADSCTTSTDNFIADANGTLTTADTTPTDDSAASTAMEVVNILGREKLEKIILQLNEEKAKQAKKGRNSERVINLETKLLGIMEAELESEGSLSNGSLHLIRWKDRNGNKKTFRLVDRVSARWNTFGLLLGISQNQLRAWEEQYRGNANMCWTKVMEYWLNGVGKDSYPPTWEGLYMLLEDAEYSQIAEELKRAVDENTAKDDSISADERSTASTTTPLMNGASGTPLDENTNKIEQLIKELNEEKTKLQMNTQVYENSIAEGQGDVPELGGDLSGIMRRHKQSILDIEGAIEAEIKKEGNSLSIGTLHLLKWVDGRGHVKSYRLVDKVSTQWREIGQACGLSTNQLTAWESQYRGNVRMCWTRVMEQWLKGDNDDYPATWKGLCTLLRDIEFSTVSAELEESVIAACAGDDEASAVDSTAPIDGQLAGNSPTGVHEAITTGDSSTDDQVCDDYASADVVNVPSIDSSTDEPFDELDRLSPDNGASETSEDNSTTPVIVTPDEITVEAQHLLEMKITDLNKKRSENTRWLADDENAISKYQRQIEDPSTNEERREELKTLVQFWDSYVQKRKITVLETESDITKKMNGMLLPLPGESVEANSKTVAQAAEAVSHTFNHVINCLPEFDHAIKAITEASQKLQSETFPSSGGASYKTLQNKFSAAAADLNVSGSEVIAVARSTPEVQVETIQKFASQFEELLTTGLTLAGASMDKESRNEMLEYLRTISVSTSKLLLAAKALSADPNAPNMVNQLTIAAHSVTDAINSLLSLCSTSGPGQKECDIAIRSIEAVASVLNYPNVPVSDLSYLDCVDLVLEKSKVLGEAGDLIASHARRGEIEAFSRAVDCTAIAVCQLTEASAQAAYLVGIADRSITASQTQVTQFTRVSQSLASELDANCQECSQTTRPLTQFASTPAKDRKAQEHIIQAGKNVNLYSSSLLTLAKNLVVNTNDPPMWQLVASHTKAVIGAIKSLILTLRDRYPGQTECDNAIGVLAAVIQQLASSMLQGFPEQMLESSSNINDTVFPLATAAKGDAEKLGHQVTAMANLFPSLAGAAIGAASKTSSSQMQSSLLEQTKTLTGSALQLVYLSREAGGNPRPTATHAKVDEAASLMSQTVAELTSMLEKAGGEARLISGMIEDINKTMGRLDDPFEGEVKPMYRDFQEKSFKKCKDLAKYAQDIMLKARTNPGELSNCSRVLTVTYGGLVDSARGALATIESHKLATRLRKTGYDLGEACKDLIHAGASVQGNSIALCSKSKLGDCANVVTEKVSLVVSAIQAGAIGTQACNEAITSIASIVGDLETIAMFCTTGSQKALFPEHHVNMLETSKLLVEDTKKLVSSAGGTQKALAEVVTNAVKNITSEADHVKLGAAALDSDDIEAQLLLLTAMKDVANASGVLISTTSIASGKSVQDPAMEELKTSAKVMNSKVFHLLKTVKNVEDEASKRVQSLENTIDAITAAVLAYKSGEMEASKTTPEDLVRCTKAISLASAKAVLAGKSGKQVDVSACTNMSRKAVGELLRTCLGTSELAENDDDRDRILAAGCECADAFRSLLELIHQILLKPTAEKKAMLPAMSNDVTSHVGKVISAVSVIRASLAAEGVDTSDPNVMAGTELLTVAASIEAAAKKLAELRPRTKSHADESLNFEDQILEAAKNIASATSTLVKSATAAQRELVMEGKLNSNPKSEDGQWSEGLVSAAKLVANATGNLCEAANDVVQGQAQEEKLIVAAKAVAASTAQLLIACQVKADPRSENNKRLQLAGAAVKKATETIVKAAQDSHDNVAEEEASRIHVRPQFLSPSHTYLIFIHLFHISHPSPLITPFLAVYIYSILLSSFSFFPPPHSLTFILPSRHLFFPSLMPSVPHINILSCFSSRSPQPDEGWQNESVP